MAGNKIDIDSVKLQVAKPVENVPEIGKGSVISQLREFQDATALIMAVKDGADVSGRKWEIFDKDRVIKESPEAKKLKKLVSAFADKVRRLIESQGVGKRVRLEQRKDKFYLVGVGR